MRTILTALAAGLLIYCFSTAAAEPQPAAIAARNPILEPPINPGQTLDVGVGLHILNIASIDEVDEQFTVDGYLLTRWIDPRLVFTPVSPVDLVHRPQTGEIWIPCLEMINGATPRERYDVVALVSPDGTVNYAERFKVALSARFALRRFPFDKQVLPIIIHPFYSSAGYMRLSLSARRTWAASEFSAYSSLAQWELLALHPRLTTGVGSVYLCAYKDKDGDWLDGARSYRLRVPPNAPVEQFWSLTIYDVSTRTLIANKEQIADRSSRMQLVKNAEGSVDLYVGPKAPSGFEKNWIPTVPGKAWFAYFRLYAPTEAHFNNHTWTLPDFEEAR